MRIQEPLSRAPLTQRREYTYIGRDGICRTEQEQVLCELHMKVQVSHAYSFSVVCIPEYLPELILGRLLTSGLISSADDVEEIRIDSSLKTADAILKEPLPGVNGPVPPAAIPLFPSHIVSLADRFSGGMPLHSQTFATHSCFLAREDRLLFQCEDIGRHNAVDKAVGYALRRGIPLGSCILYSSGRAPADMVLKAIRAGIPVFASKASPTAEAVSLARQYHLTLICAARRDRMKLFAGAPWTSHP